MRKPSQNLCSTDRVWGPQIVDPWSSVETLSLGLHLWHFVPVATSNEELCLTCVRCALRLLPAGEQMSKATYRSKYSTCTHKHTHLLWQPRQEVVTHSQHNSWAPVLWPHEKYVAQFCFLKHQVWLHRMLRFWKFYFSWKFWVVEIKDTSSICCFGTWQDREITGFKEEKEYCERC